MALALLCYTGSCVAQCNQATVQSFTPQALGLLVGEDDTDVTLTASNDVCSFADSRALDVVPEPIIDQMVPPAVCFDQTTAVAIVGSRFSTGLATGTILQQSVCSLTTRTPLPFFSAFDSCGWHEYIESRSGILIGENTASCYPAVLGSFRSG